MKKLIVFLIGLLSFISVNATTYYFNNSIGNDANNGTSTATPWKTLGKFNSVFASRLPGDNILFNRGDVFYGNMTISRSGSSGSPITIGAYGTGANPVITGFQDATGFASAGTNLWETAASVSALTSCNEVLINGVNVSMGRFPNSGYLTYQSAVGTTSITSTSTPSGTTNWTGAGLVVRMNFFVTLRCPITGHSGNTITYTPSNTGINAVAGFGFYIQNDLRTLDAQNEWYFNPSTKRLRIYSTSSPANVQVSTIDTLVKMVGRSFITFDGLSFTGSNKDAFTIMSCANLTIQNCTIDYSGQDAVWGAQNGGSASSAFVFQNNTINHTNNSAISLENQFTAPLISHNTISNSGMDDGMGGTGAGNYGTLFGIQVQADNAIIEYNTVDGAGYDGIKFVDHNGNIVRNNFVRGACFQKIDGGGIYTQHAQTGQQILNNIVVDCVGTLAGTTGESTPIAHGIYLDDLCASVTVTGNTCAGNSYDGIFLHSTTNCNIQNNTFYNNGTTNNFQMLVESFSGPAPTRTTTIKHNIFFAKSANQRASAWTSGANDFTSFGSASTIDSNYITRPIDDNLTIIAGLNFSYTSYSLSTWRSFSGYDTHSAKAPVTISTVNDLDFEYNATSSPVTIPLAFKYEDVYANIYNGTITLQPYTSAVLIKIGAITGGGGTALPINVHHNNIVN